MIALETRMSPSVWESSGERFRVQWRKSARSSEKSHVLASHIFTCRSLRVMSVLP